MKVTFESTTHTYTPLSLLDSGLLLAALDEWAHGTVPEDRPRVEALLNRLADAVDVVVVENAVKGSSKGFERGTSSETPARRQALRKEES